MKNEGYDSFEEEKSSKSDDEVQPQTLAFRRLDCWRRPIERYSPPDSHCTFVLSTINYEPRSINDTINFEEVKL